MVFWAGKVQYFTWFLALPLLLGPHTAMVSMGLMLTTEMTMAWVLAFMF